MSADHGWEHLDLGHPEALAEALAEKEKLDKLQAKYGMKNHPSVYAADPAEGGHALLANWDGKKWTVQNSWSATYQVAQVEIGPWAGEAYEGTSLMDGLKDQSVTIDYDASTVSPQLLAALFGVPPEVVGAAVSPEPQTAWCALHSCYVTAEHPGDLVACISDGWVVPVAPKKGSAA